MKRFFYTLVIIGMSSSISAQSVIKGNIISSEDGGPLPGVNVIVKGTTIGTVSDIDGNYTLELEENYFTLQFSFIGLLTQEHELMGSQTLDVSMDVDTAMVSSCHIMCCFCSSNYIRVGYETGMNYSPYGVRIKHFFGYGLGISPYVETNLAFRSGKRSEKYFELSVRKRRLFWAGPVITGLFIEADRFKTEFKDIRSLVVSPEFYAFGARIGLGYTYQQRIDREQTKEESGLYANVRYSPFRNLSIEGHGKFFEDSIQPKVELSYTIWKANLILKTGYARVDQFDEYTMTALYEINY